jgi:8-oxo-dGTP pyrophosphatase MutT (NUDIX family)
VPIGNLCPCGSLDYLYNCYACIAIVAAMLANLCWQRRDLLCAKSANIFFRLDARWARFLLGVSGAKPGKLKLGAWGQALYELPMVNDRLFKIVSKLVLQPFHRQTRGLTLGTRTAVFDQEGRVLLVKHTYASGWLLPGGGVERGETIYQSAAREIREEAAILAEEEPILLGFCLNDAQFPGDHIAVLAVRKFRQLPWKPSLEISHAQFFGTGQLPPDTTGGTRRRIDELISNRAVGPIW